MYSRTLFVLLKNMTTPRVTELPRRLEPVGRDTFLGAAGGSSSTAPAAGAVVALRPRRALAPLSAAASAPPPVAA